MPSLVDFRKGFGGIIAALSVVTLAVSGILTLSGGVAGGALFLDTDKHVSSTFRIAMDGNLGTLSTSGTITSAGSLITSAATANIACNGLAANCTIGQSNGVGTLKTTSGGDTMLQTWNGTAFTDRIKIEGSQLATEVSITGGVSSTHVTTSRIYIGPGSGSEPSIAFDNDTDTGIARGGTNQLAVIAGGGIRLEVSSSAVQPRVNLLPFSDDSYDIGSSALRFQDAWFSRAVSSTNFHGPAGTAGAPTYSFAGASEADSGLYSDAVGSIAISADGVRNLVVRSGAVFVSPSLQPFNAGAASIGTNTAPFGALYASTTAATSLPAITSTGTLRIANQASPTTTIEMTGRFCMKVLDMVGGTQRYITIASGSFVISTTDCR